MATKQKTYTVKIEGESVNKIANYNTGTWEVSLEESPHAPTIAVEQLKDSLPCGDSTALAYSVRDNDVVIDSENYKSGGATSARMVYRRVSMLT